MSSLDIIFLFIYFLKQCSSFSAFGIKAEFGSQNSLDNHAKTFQKGLEINAVSNESLIWPNSVIFYEIDRTYDEDVKRNFLKAMKNIQDVSCVKFKPKTSLNHDYIHIYNNKTDCHSPIGRRGGRQRIDLLNPNCTSEGFAVHALLHAVGFDHMHNDNSRDEYIKIVWENVQDGYEYEFRKNGDTNNYKLPYDYNSIMHYPLNKRSKNGLNTMEPLRSFEGNIGELKVMSETDIVKINSLYHCPIVST